VIIFAATVVEALNIFVIHRTRVPAVVAVAIAIFSVLISKQSCLMGFE
jgi:hypothetical protein